LGVGAGGEETFADHILPIDPPRILAPIRVGTVSAGSVASRRPVLWVALKFRLVPTDI